jgi:hypothetical protein
MERIRTAVGEPGRDPVNIWVVPQIAAPPTHEALLEDLRLVRGRGLPRLRVLVVPALTQAALLIGGAAVADTPAATELMLRNAIGRLGGGEYEESARLLFGFEQGQRASSSRVRREYAAAAVHRTAETYRKSYEGDILRQIATQILQLVEERLAARPQVTPLPDVSPILKQSGGTSPLDDAVEAAVLQGLTRQYVPGSGFPSQTYGERAYSLATTGICAYAIATACDDQAREILAFIGDAIDDDGTLRTHQYQGGWFETTWASGQCLLALTAAPALADEHKAKALAQRLLESQTESRGWPLRPGDDDPFDPLFALYPLLSLIGASRTGWVTPDDLERALQRMREPLRVELYVDRRRPARRLIAEFEVDLIAKALRQQEDLYATLRRGPAQLAGAASFSAPDTYAELASYVAFTRDQPLWYAKVWRPGLYLLARRVYPLDAPICLLLGAELVETYLPRQAGWQPDSDDPTSPAFTWTTALGLLAVRRLREDLATLSVDAAGWHQLVDDARRAAWR